MFKRKRVKSPSRSASPSPTSSPAYLDDMQKQARADLNKAKEEILPDLLARLNADIQACHSTFHSLQNVPVRPTEKDEFTLGCLRRPKKGESDIHFFLILQQTFSHWSCNPIFVQEEEENLAPPWTSNDILLSFRASYILEATKSLIFLKFCRGSRYGSTNKSNSSRGSRY